MKKIICIVLAVILITFAGCAKTDEPLIDFDEQRYVTGVWLSYAEIDAMLQKDFKTEFDAFVKNCAKQNISDVFVHTVPFCDSYYPSEFYPQRTTQNFDVLSYMVDACHNNDLKIHAWINPYRVRTVDSDITALPDKSPAKQWLCDESEANDTNVSVCGGVYLNPASSEVRALVIGGVREIIDNYNVDGIHFDDYFYPTKDEAFDAQSYKDYCTAAKNPISLADFRRANVNALISGVYTAVKFKNKRIAFSVSPTASIDENYSRHYADVVAWVQNNCVDYIIPQLYFGFDYPDDNFKFDKLLADWQEITQNTQVKLVIGLAAYKIGTENEPDKTEWADGKEIINRQVEICKSNNSISGYVFFSYSSARELLWV